MNRNIKKGPVTHKVLSDRGVLLEQAHRASMDSNVNTGQTSFVMTSGGGKDFAVKVGTRCPQCKMRVRGLNHENGHHHRGNVPKCGR